MHHVNTGLYYIYHSSMNVSMYSASTRMLLSIPGFPIFPYSLNVSLISFYLCVYIIPSI